MRQAIDDLPSVSASRLRALGEITAETKTTIVRFDEHEFTVALSLVRFPNGGSWSFLVCGCGRRARAMRLLDGHLRCRRCCKARGLRYRVELIRTEKRVAYHEPRLIARLTSDKPARLHPRPGRMLDRRAPLEAKLKRSQIVARRARIAQFEKDLSRT
jgi:hypothetical protein